MAFQRTLAAHVETWRPYTMLYIGLVGLAGALLTDGSAGPAALTLAWLVPTLGWIGGHYGGDYFDRELDAGAKPHRPIPSGRLRAGTALAMMIVLVAAGGLLAVWANPWTPLLVAAALAAGIGYSAVLKARGIGGNLVRGSLTAFVVAFGAMMAATWPPLRVLPVALVFLLHDTQSNLVGTLRDVAGDRAAGYETFPVRHGARPALRVVAGMTLAWAAVAAAVPAFTPASAAGRAACYALLAVSAALAAAAIALLVRSPEPMPPAVALRAHALLVVERTVLACAFVGLAAGPAAALLAAAPAVLVTALLQARMRAHHEFGRPAPIMEDNRT
ncbi:UbiA family prenyltransferase [Actinomadura parmotrematis]|uniref:UbiA family prenyltransferase n=1 Tax=Actinomadura parmotrematis TaxID=2864039 RepID=A0ABS7FV44_9ACTN|nr:UbiA family prenyltransferase [Actinomadura parmotrematis]MBW8484297.1 UbiA family prenyltransferase [Actinomadura parmotrematis]